MLLLPQASVLATVDMLETQFQATVFIVITPVEHAQVYHQANVLLVVQYQFSTQALVNARLFRTIARQTASLALTPVTPASE